MIPTSAKAAPLLASTLALLACAATTAEAPIEQAAAYDVGGVLQTIAEGDHRSDKNRSRNRWRHPAKTLEFFGIRPDMTVVEISPGGGWYTEILAPFLRDRGTLYAAHYDPNHEREYFRTNAARFADKMASDPALYGKVQITVFSPPENVDGGAPAGSADLVVTFRNTHNWMRNDGQQAAYDAIYKMLKPGGVFGVVQHRGDAAAAQHPTGKFGYVRESNVIELATAAGFEHVASSEINANPRDTKDHPEGVWNLPPAFRGKDENRARYEAIGESDRMTLKFVKPK